MGGSQSSPVAFSFFFHFFCTIRTTRSLWKFAIIIDGKVEGLMGPSLSGAWLACMRRPSDQRPDPAWAGRLRSQGGRRLPDFDMGVMYSMIIPGTAYSNGQR